MGSTVPTRIEKTIQDFIGVLFEKYWEQFLETHKDGFELFLKENDLTSPQLSLDGIDLELLSKQWCAAQMVYYLCKYGGLLGVNYYTKDSLDLSHLKIQNSSTDVITAKGPRFGLLLKDIAFGTQYILRNKKSFNTFGDCDEIVFFSSQLLTAISNYSKIGIEASLDAEDSHALMKVAFPRVGSLFLDLTYGDSKTPSFKLVPLVPRKKTVEAEMYAQKSIPILNKQLKASPALSVTPQSAATLERAVRDASTLSHEVLLVVQSSNRKNWKDLKWTLLNTLYTDIKKLPVNERVVELAITYIASFFDDPIKAYDILRKNNEGMGLDKQFDSLTSIASKITARKMDLKKTNDLETYFSTYAPKKVALN